MEESLTSSDDSKSTFFGSCSSESELLPNFFLRIDFTDRGALETSNKQKVDTFWKYIESKRSFTSMLDLPTEQIFPRKDSTKQSFKEVKKLPKRPWIAKLVELEYLGMKDVATAAIKSCKNEQKKDGEYSPITVNKKVVCSELRGWNKEFKVKRENEPQPEWNAYKKSIL